MEEPDSLTELGRVVQGLELDETGEVQRFPYDEVMSLLSSDVMDNWIGGLYLLSRLEPSEIAERYFTERAVCRALATFLFAESLDMGSSQVVESYFLNQENIRDRYRERWNPPQELLERVYKKYLELANFLRSVNSSSNRPTIARNRKIAVIVHGTFAAAEKWWRPNTGSLWSHIKPFWNHLYDGPTPFFWSGVNNHAARVTAANQLVAWVNSRRISSVDIIAHSHGGNVALLAAQLGLSINHLILLGTPIRTEYMLTLKNIKTITNVFSLSDRVQTPLGTLPNRRFEGRTLGDSETVTNIRAEDNGAGKGPGHSELHEPSTWTASSLDALLR